MRGNIALEVNAVLVSYRWPLGIDMSAAVAGAYLKLPKEPRLLDT